MSRPTRQRVAKVRAVVIDTTGLQRPGHGDGMPGSASADGPQRRGRTERLAGEEPLEIRVMDPSGAVVATTATMRTPGQDFALAAGLLYAEGVIAAADDIERISYCAEAGEQGGGPRAEWSSRDITGSPAAGRFNTVTVRLTRAPRRDLAARSLMATASCGVCGTASIDGLEARLAGLAAARGAAADAPGVVADTPPADTPPLNPAPFDPALLARLPAALRAAQPLFDETGGLHAAGLFDRSGRALEVAEDVGRHNALDKVLGARLLAGGLPAPETIAVLSGRVSFELVQKVAVAGVPVICAVSAPSSLAVTTAERLGLTLAGFVRDGRLTVYTHAGRVSTAAVASGAGPEVATTR